jgi:hypothetical protein
MPWERNRSARPVVSVLVQLGLAFSSLSPTRGPLLSAHPPDPRRLRCVFVDPHVDVSYTFLEDMSQFGSPVNFCVQRPESLLIPAAKHPGRHAQKQIEGSAYEVQAAQRLVYAFMIDTIHTRIWDNPHYDSDAPDRNNAVESLVMRLFRALSKQRLAVFVQSSRVHNIIMKSIGTPEHTQIY